MQIQTLSNQQLRCYDINICNHFCDRMFHLDARVDFDKVKIISFNKKFYCTCVDIPDIFHQLDSCLADFLTLLFIHRDTRRYFYYFLVTALNRTISFKKMDDVSMRIPENLYFDMLRISDVFFNIHFITTKGCFCFAFRTFVALSCTLFIVSYTHAASAAA